MMPHALSQKASHFASSAGLFATGADANIPWAVSTEERARYGDIFRAWDLTNSGFISGDKAKEVFSQSGLPQNVLMQIW